MSAKQGTHCFVVVEESATAPDACEASTAIAAVEDGQLMIEKVILENFKSYGGRHILGPFHHKFSSIVGPNGSGKSNIIDAMLFVFGRRAQQLRHKKLVGLIHHSPAYPNVTSTRVEVYFRNVIHTPGLRCGEFVTGTDFVIAREAFNDGTSRYTINGQPTMQKDVMKLLRDRGVDLDHNRFLILQGEVEQIAMMKPKGQSANEEGLLEYLEDIIGSNRYISEIEQAKERLQSTVESLQGKREAMLAVQAQVDTMEAPLQMARELCKAERKVLLLKSQLEQKASLAIRREIQRTQEAYDRIKAEWDAWNVSREGSKQKIKELEGVVGKQELIIKKAEKMLSQAEAEFSALERLDNELAAKQSHCLKRAQALAKETAKLEEEQLKCVKDVERLTKRGKELEQEIPKERDTVTVLEGRVEAIDKELEKDFDVLRRKKEFVDEQLEPETIKLGELTAALGVCKAQILLLKEHRSSAVARLQSLKQKASLSRDLLKSKEKALKEADAALDKLKNDHSKKRQIVLSLRDQLVSQKNELQSTFSQVDAKECQLMKTRNEKMLVPAILAAKEDGRLRGVIDRLWNLGSVDPKFELAVAAVAGSEYILVEETKDAERVVSFVRKHNLGRVTCIVMSHIRRELTNDLRNLRNRKTVPSSAQLLLDQIQLEDSQYEIAFYFVLRDILVVSTLDEARLVAFGGSTRWRVVTLEGHVIDKSGAMSGGGFKKVGSDKLMIFKRQYAAKSANSLAEATTSQKEIEQLRVKIRDLNSQIAKTQNAKMNAEQELTQIEEKMSSVRDARLRCTAEKEAAEQDITHYSNAVNECDVPEFSAKEQRELDRLTQEMTVVEGKVEVQKRVVDKHQAALDKIKKDIEMIGGGKRQRTRDAMLLAKNGLDELVEELQKGEVEVSLQKKRLDVLKRLIPEKLADTQREHETAKKYTDERNELTDKAEVVLRKKEELENILREQKEIAREKRAALKLLVDESKQSGLQEVQFQTQLQDIDQTLTALRSNLQKHKKLLHRIQEDWSAIPVFDTLNTVPHPPSEKSIKEDNVIVKTEEMSEVMDLDLAEDVLDNVDEVLVSCEIKNLTESALTVKVDLSVIEKYKAASLTLKERTAEVELCCSKRDATARELDSLELSRFREFTRGFLCIASKVKEMYQMITHEGDAELELADPSSPFTSGVMFSVRPPKKSWKRIQNLSGGEKTLSSLALVFALHHFRPTPIYFLDEIDAALDHWNVSTIGLYIASQAKNAQFIIISLRNHMFEMADRLLGIYKVSGTTQTTFIDPDDFVDDEDQKGTLALLDREAEKQQSCLKPATFKATPFFNISSLTA